MRFRTAHHQPVLIVGRRRLGVVVAALAVLATLLAHPAAADPQPEQDTDSAQEQVRKQMAEVASQIDTSKATIDEIDAALATLDANAATQQAALAKAQADLASAEAQQARAERAIAASAERIELLRAVMRERAVGAYVNPPTDNLLTDIATGDYLTASKRSVFIGMRAASDAELAQALRRAQNKLRAGKQKARDAAGRATEEQARQVKLLANTRAAMDERHQVFEKLRVTLTELAVRGDQLAVTDQALTAQRAQAQALLQSRLLAEAQAAAAPPVRIFINPTNNFTFGGTEAEPLAPGAYSGGGLTGLSLCNVGGITVNCVIAYPLQAMLDAASKSGITLSGGGFRDPYQQIALRRSNCGDSYFAIYQAGSSSCSPPTARPGTSQHEVGLAIDFAIGGSRGTPAFQWLAANAASYGFYNLPSEAWHWSTSGS